MKKKPAEAVSDLDALGAVAAAADKGILLDGEAGSATAAGAAPGPSSPGAALPDPAQEWAQFPALFGSIIGQAMPELVPVYSDAACRAWGEAMVPLADKYGWKPAAFMAWLGPWLGVAIATWPLAVPTVLAVRARRAHVDAVDAAVARGLGTVAAAMQSNVVAMPGAGEDPDLRDPTTTNRPPRPL